MNKRRRAYKKYDWHNHCMQLISDQLKRSIIKRNADAIDIAILYGRNALGWKKTDMVLTAGLYRITVTVPTPYRKGGNNDKN